MAKLHEYQAKAILEGAGIASGNGPRRRGPGTPSNTPTSASDSRSHIVSPL